MSTATNHIPRHLIILMAACCALAVSTIYYQQPLLPQIAHSFGLTPTQGGLIATSTQLGYAAGLLLIVPLGDRYQPRILASIAVSANAIALLACAIAPSFMLLCISCFLVGLTAITAQIVIPSLTGLAALSDRGKVVGILLSGLSTGLLLARVVGGFVGENFGWRSVFIMASFMDIFLLTVILTKFPPISNLSSTGYFPLIRSLGSLFTQERSLRYSSASGFLMFASFSAFWATIAALLIQPPYNFGPATIGLFGLIAVVGVFASPSIGALADRWGGSRMAIAGSIAILIGFACIAAGARNVIWLIIGIALLDIGNRAGSVANQSRIINLRPEARSRLNTVFMGTYFMGGAAGAALGNYGVHWANWIGLTVVGVALGLAATALNIYSARLHDRTSC